MGDKYLERVKNYLEYELKAITASEDYHADSFLLKQFPERFKKVLKAKMPSIPSPEEVKEEGPFNQEYFNRMSLERRDYFLEVSNELNRLKRHHCLEGSFWDSFRSTLEELSKECSNKALMNLEEIK